MAHQKYILFYAYLTKKTGIILILSHRTAIVVLLVVIFVFDTVREKRSVPLLNRQVVPVSNVLATHRLKIPG